MFTRRTLVQSLMAAGVAGRVRPLAAQDRYDQDALLAFDPLGTLTLLYIADLHGFLRPHHHRPPQVHLGPDGRHGTLPHLVGEDLRIRYGIGGAAPLDSAFTHENYAEHAAIYGPMGGLDRVAAVINAIRGARPGALLLAGGEAGDGLRLLKPDVETRDGTGKPTCRMLSRNGAALAIVGIAKDARLETLAQMAAACQREVDEARAAGAGVVVCLSQLGFAANTALAGAVTGVDVILSGGDHIALPEPERVGDTQVIASGAQGRFVARIDLDVQEGALQGSEHKLIPIFSDLIRLDAGVTAQVDRIEDTEALDAQIARTDTVLYRRGSLASTWDDLICTTVLRETGAQIALLPGLRQGISVLAEQPLTVRAVNSICGDATLVQERLTGAQIKAVLEREAEQAFSAQPYHREGRDMMRAGGLAFSITPAEVKGNRIRDLRLLHSDVALAPDTPYTVARWAPPSAGGLRLSDVVTEQIRKLGAMQTVPVTSVDLITQD